MAATPTTTDVPARLWGECSWTARDLCGAVPADPAGPEATEDGRPEAEASLPIFRWFLALENAA